MASEAPVTIPATSKTNRVSKAKEPAKAACFTCRRKKVRCSGTSPCTYCSKRGLECALPELGQRRAYSILQVQKLRDRLARFENSDAFASHPDVVNVLVPPTGETPFSSAENATAIRSPLPTPVDVAEDATQLPLALSEPRVSVLEQTSPLSHRDINRDTSLTSSHTFGSRVQSLLETSSYKRPINHSYSTNTTKSLPSMEQMPTEHEAYRLLEVVIFYIGETQHHFDVRQFTDRLGEFYAKSLDMAQESTPWVLEMLLILSIGQLFSGHVDCDSETPGDKLFNHAYTNLPTLGELYTLGSLGVELLALVAVYLQNINRKDEAYLHISTALRLAVSLGFHRRSGSQQLLKSQQIHINRLWWTVYMQERRLAAATGNPCSINDEAIELAPPTDRIGYSTSGLLRINLRISRVLSRILTVIYGNERLAEDSFIPNVRDIVKSIFEIAQDIPPENLARYPGLSLDSSTRASAYLHIMLYQALILTTRPVMLHVVNKILNGEIRDLTALDVSPLARFCRSCSEAARRLLDVICGLRERNMLMIFGFFDFDAVLSAAFVMILSTVIDSIGTISQPSRDIPPPGLQIALETLQFLAGRGNYFAQRGYEDARQTWLHFTAYQQRRVQRRMSQDQSPSNVDLGSSDRDLSNSSTSKLPATPVTLQNTSNAAARLTETWNQPASVDYDPFRSSAGNQALSSDTDLLSNLAHLWDETTNPVPEEMITEGNECPPASTVDELHNSLYPMYSTLDLALGMDDLEQFAEFRKNILNL
ncbi:hypothetical protein MYU51_007511 [Penicillium brevicompactum]